MEKIRTITIQQGAGRAAVTLIMHITDGKGLCGFLFGGETPHVGGVVYSIPRYDRDEDHLTTDVSTICGPGHRDVLAAQRVAAAISVATGESTCITAGIHIDRATPDEIKALMDNCMEISNRFIAGLKGNSQGVTGEQSESDQL
jgi:hypothetical protein